MSGKTILIVDDAVFMRTILRGILTPHACTVVEATNGSEAVDRYSESKPDLVFMDITRPIMDGITATRKIKEQHPEAKIVMCSAMGQNQTLLEAVRAGAEGFVVKPFQPDAVLTATRKAFN